MRILEFFLQGTSCNNFARIAPTARAPVPTPSAWLGQRTPSRTNHRFTICMRVFRWSALSSNIFLSSFFFRCSAPDPHENPVEFLRRRNRQATATMNLHGKWITKHCKRAVAWNNHLRRPRNGRAWAAALLKFRDEQWIEQQRRDNSVGHESRTRTRASPGFVAMRWHDGVRLAAAHCTCQRA